MREDLIRAAQILRRKRQYAAFFEWPDKEIKEYGIAEELIDSLNAHEHLGLTDLRIQRPDPPDLVCRIDGGGVVGIEVAEIVCEHSVREAASGRSTVRDWRPGELASKVRNLVERKDRKPFLGGPYAERWICLFTDEPMLTVRRAREDLSHVDFGPLHQIDRAFLLFSYDPSIQGYPVVPIAVHK